MWSFCEPCVVCFIMQVFLRGDIIDRRQQQCEQAESNLGNATCITMENSTGFVDVQFTNNTVTRCFSFPSSLKCHFLQAVSSSIVWSLILFGRYYPSVLIYNATVASNARVRCNPIFPKLGREDSSRIFFLPVTIRCVYFLCPVVLPRNCNICRTFYPFAQESANIAGNRQFLSQRISAQTFWNLTFWRKIQRNRCGLIFRDWRTTSGCTLKTLASRISWEKYSERTRALRDVYFYVVLLLFAHIMHSFALLQISTKKGVIFCFIFMTRWLRLRIVCQKDLLGSSR